MSRTDSIVVVGASAPHEKEACFVIRREVFIDEQLVPLDMEIDEYDTTALHFLAFRDHEPVAAARVVFKDDGMTAKIGRVAVLKPTRGLGIGRAIMQAIEADFDVKWAAKFFLEAQTHAIPFYEYLGYESYGDEYMDAGIPHRFMFKINTAACFSTNKDTG